MPSSLDVVCSTCRSRIAGLPGRVRTLHRDENGTISVLSVVSLVMLTMLMGMILNVGEQMDDKIKLQNAADAATYSSGVVIARGMNSIAFTNHLLSETFALTAYFREGRDRFAESLVPEILDAWEQVGSQLSRAEFHLFKAMQPAISPKVRKERELVKTFGEMTAMKAKLLLPSLHTILGTPEDSPLSSAGQQKQIAATHLIPVFQRAVVLAVPAAAAAVSQEITRRNTPTGKSATSTSTGKTANANAGPTQCVLWNSQTFPLQGVDQTDPYQRLLPGLDPSFEGPDFVHLTQGEAGIYQAAAYKRRNDLAFQYLSYWINDMQWDLAPFERESYFDKVNMPDEYLPPYLETGGMISGKMSQFKNLYRGFTCAKLNILLQQEFPTTNLPHMLRVKSPVSTQQEYLENEFTVTGAIYRKQRPPTMPGMYRSLMRGDSMAFARVSLYIPRAQYVRYPCGYYWVNKVQVPINLCFNNWSPEWSLFNQNWAAKILPTSAENTVNLLQTNPRQYAPGVNLPDFTGIDVRDLKAINTH